mgnify:FL=1|jgi:hypothetical protein
MTPIQLKLEFLLKKISLSGFIRIKTEQSQILTVNYIWQKKEKNLVTGGE